MADLSDVSYPAVNNKWMSCPAIMADGRSLNTDYRPRSRLAYENKINVQNYSSYEQRQYLIHNAESILKKQRNDLLEKYSCGECVNPYKPPTSEYELQQCDKNVCNFKVNDPYGIGLGRNLYDETTNSKFISMYNEAVAKENTYLKHAELEASNKDNLYYSL